MTRQRRIPKLRMENIFLGKSIKQIDNYLEDALRNSYMNTHPDIEIFIKMAKCLSVEDKFQVLTAVLKHEHEGFEMMKKRIVAQKEIVNELKTVIDKWEHTAVRAVDLAERLHRENMTKEACINASNRYARVLGGVIRNLLEENRQLKAKDEEHKQDVMININITQQPHSLLQELTQSTSNATVASSAEMEGVSLEEGIVTKPYERALNMIMKCKPYFKGKNIKRFTEKYRILFDSHPEFLKKLDGASFDKLVCQMIGAMVDEGYFSVSTYNTFAMILEPNDEKKMKCYAKYMGLAKKENAPYMVKEWKKLIKS